MGDTAEEQRAASHNEQRVADCHVALTLDVSPPARAHKPCNAQADSTTLTANGAMRKEFGSRKIVRSSFSEPDGLAARGASGTGSQMAAETMKVQPAMAKKMWRQPIHCTSMSEGPLAMTAPRSSLPEANPRRYFRPSPLRARLTPSRRCASA
jgi:hypothetical protein